MKQKWTQAVLERLPATVRELNKSYVIRSMNYQHRADRLARGKWALPINSMVYDTLRRLKRQGRVVRRENGTYEETK